MDNIFLIVLFLHSSNRLEETRGASVHVRHMLVFFLNKRSSPAIIDHGIHKLLVYAVHYTNELLNTFFSSFTD